MKILTKACQSPVFALKLSVLVSSRLHYILLSFSVCPVLFLFAEGKYIWHP